MSKLVQKGHNYKLLQIENLLNLSLHSEHKK